MQETKLQRRIGLFARFLPEVADLYEKINQCKKEYRHLTDKKCKTLTDYLPFTDMSAYAYTQKRIKISRKRDAVYCKRKKLEEKAKRIIDELIEVLWSNDNPNICSLRKELILTAKLIQDGQENHTR